MSTPVVSVPSGGIAVVDVTATTGIGLPVSEAANGFGLAVTKVVGNPGLPVVYRVSAMAKDDGNQPV